MAFVKELYNFNSTRLFFQSMMNITYHTTKVIILLQKEEICIDKVK